MSRITAAMLYDCTRCPTRVQLDQTEDPVKRDPVSPFVQLLWERGSSFEKETVKKLAVPFLDLSDYRGDEKEQRTLEALKNRVSLIYSARISSGNLLGEPDLLRLEGKGYTAGDIKSGAGLEGETDDGEGEPKEHYAVQLALYTDILERMGLSSGRDAFVWDVHGNEIPYDLEGTRGKRDPKVLWSTYESYLDQVERILAGEYEPRPALCSDCSLCHWRNRCLEVIEKMEDVSLVPGVGRKRRDKLQRYFEKVGDIATATDEDLAAAEPKLERISLKTLVQFRARAKLQKEKSPEPYFFDKVSFPDHDLELFFDIETDPMRDICYLHGFVERRGGDNSTEVFKPAVAASPNRKDEREAFEKAWEYVMDCWPCAVYHYAPYEKTWWKKLQERYPGVVGKDEMEAFLEDPSVVDLYNGAVLKSIWPTRGHSIKILARYLGFKWKDIDPSGASSVQWFHDWVTTKDGSIMQRILDYNQDDCVAMRVLLDRMRRMGRKLLT